MSARRSYCGLCQHWHEPDRPCRTAEVPERDQWGETHDERQARIYKRDLAFFVYSEGHNRDGVPCSPSDRLHFNAGYDAGRTDYLPQSTDDLAQALFRTLHDSGVSFESATLIPKLVEAVRGAS
jgi:hypothetical protein